MSNEHPSGNGLRAWADAVEAEGDNPDAHEARITDLGGTHIPADRIATFGSRIGRIEHPTEMWPMLTTFAPKPNPRADEEFEPWVEQFIKGAQDGGES
jgi:hypothetical protein